MYRCLRACSPSPSCGRCSERSSAMQGVARSPFTKTERSSAAARKPTWQTVAEEHERSDQLHRQNLEELREMKQEQDALMAEAQRLLRQQRDAVERMERHWRSYGGTLLYAKQEHRASSGCV